MLRITTLVTFIAVGAFVSQAQAHDRDGFYANPIFRGPANTRFSDQNRINPNFLGQPKHESHCERDRRERMEAEFAHMREEQLAAIAAQKTVAAAAAKQRARLIAQQKQQAARLAAAKAAARERAEAAERAAGAQKAAVAVAAKKEDLAPVATRTNTTIASSEICHKFSVAADGPIDIPCK